MRLHAQRSRLSPGCGRYLVDNIARATTSMGHFFDAQAHGIPLLHKPIEVDVLRAWVRKLLTLETA